MTLRHVLKDALPGPVIILQFTHCKHGSGHMLDVIYSRERTALLSKEAYFHNRMLYTGVTYRDKEEILQT